MVTSIKKQKAMNTKDGKDLRKLTVGAASVLLGTSIYLGNATTAKADQVQTENNNDNSNQVNDPSTESTTAAAQSIQSPAVPLSQNTGNTANGNAANSAPVDNSALAESNVTANQSSQLNSQYYNVDSSAVYETNGQTADQNGHVSASFSLTIPDTSKVNDGNYIDIKLGAPTSDGQYINYADTIAGNTAVNITGSNGQQYNVGTVEAMGADTESPYYRLIFNSNIQRVINPTIRFNLIWRSNQQRAITLVGYTGERGKNNVIFPKNDLVIGSHTYTSGLHIPVTYISPETGHSVQINTTATATDISVQHMWVTNTDGTETLQPAQIATHVDVRLADKLSNHFTVTVQVPDPAKNDFFAPQFMSDDDVAQAIKDAIKKQQSTVHVQGQLADDNSIGIGATLDASDVSVPNVTVTSSDAPEDDGYMVKKYKIDIDSNQDIKLGNQPITFAIVYSRPGVDISPASGIDSYAKDKASYDQREQENANLNDAANSDSFDWNKAFADGQATSHDSWNFVATYDGPELANKVLQNYMTSHEAAYASIHDDGDNSNNSGYDHNVVFGDGDQDVANINFLVNVANEPAANSSSQENDVSGTGKVAEQSSFTVNYIDQDMNNRVLHTDNKSGNAGDDSKYTTANEIKALQDQGYVLVSDETNGQSIQFPGESRTYTVTMKHGTKQVSQKKQITETIHYVYTDGSQAKPDYVSQPLEFTRNGQQDLVDSSKTNWGAWEPASQSFTAVTSPVIDGYTADQVTIDAQTVTANDDNIVKTVTYTKSNPDNPDNPQGEQSTITIQYVDQDNNGQTIKTDTKTGKVGTDSQYTTAAELQALKKQGYVLVSDGTNGQSIQFPAQNQTYVVTMKHGTKQVSQKKQLTETVHYVYADGSQAKPDYVSQPLEFTRTGQQDLVDSSKTNWGAWEPASQSFTAVTSPEIDGYTADQATIDAQTVTANDDNIVKTVTYTKNNPDNPDNPDNPQGEQSTITIQYVDQDNNGQVIKTDTKTGKVGTDSQYTTTGELQALRNQGYVLVSDGTNGQSIQFPAQNQTYVVAMKHGTKQVSQTKQITETIHYVYEDGSQAAPDYVSQPIVFTRNGQQDLVDQSKTNWDAWEPISQSFGAVNSPQIAGYTADNLVIDPQSVTADGNDLVMTVTYHKDNNGNNNNNNGNNNGNNSNNNGNNNNGNNANNDNGNSNNSGNNNGNQFSPSNGNGYNNGGAYGYSNGGGAAGVTNNGRNLSNVSTNNSGSPEGYHWETVRMLVPNGSNSKQQKNLPQTGNSSSQKHSRGILATLFGLILSLFGLKYAGTDRKDQE